MVIQPEKTTKAFVPHAQGDDNGLSKEGLKEKNQRKHILDSKVRYEKKDPKRKHKTHGTKAKKDTLRKYFKSAKGKKTARAYAPIKKKKKQARRQKELDEELRKNGDAKMTPEEKDAFVDAYLHTPGVLPKFPNDTIYDLVESRRIIIYSGLCGNSDRLEYERLRWLLQDGENRSVLQWDLGDGMKRLVDATEANTLLGFKTVVPFKRGSLCGFECYMLERTFMKHFEHMELGKQTLNRVTGAGNPYRGLPGVFHMFLTYARTDIFDKFPTLVVVE